jgi:hypothetical protein
MSSLPSSIHIDHPAAAAAAVAADHDKTGVVDNKKITPDDKRKERNVPAILLELMEVNGLSLPRVLLEIISSYASSLPSIICTGRYKSVIRQSVFSLMISLDLDLFADDHVRQQIDIIQKSPLSLPGLKGLPGQWTTLETLTPTRNDPIMAYWNGTLYCIGTHFFTNEYSLLHSLLVLRFSLILTFVLLMITRWSNSTGWWCNGSSIIICNAKD